MSVPSGSRGGGRVGPGARAGAVFAQEQNGQHEEEAAGDARYQHVDGDVPLERRAIRTYCLQRNGKWLHRPCSPMCV